MSEDISVDAAIDLSGGPSTSETINVMEGYEEPDDPEESESSNEIESEDNEKVTPRRRQVLLDSHIKVSKGDTPIYKCTICNHTFKWKSHVRYHEYCLTDKVKPLKCKLCDRRFVKKTHLDYHLKTHTGETPFKCAFCGKCFKQKDKVKRHELIHTGKPQFSCEICKKILSGKQALKNHILTHKLKKQYRCEICDKRYANPLFLKDHINKHSSVPLFICDKCGASFKQRSSLNNHLLGHEGARPYQCDICKKHFRNKQGLERHNVKHSREADFECLVCSATFGRKDNMLRHIKNNHPAHNDEEPKCAKNKKKSTKVAECNVQDSSPEKQSLSKTSVDSLADCESKEPSNSASSHSPPPSTQIIKSAPCQYTSVIMHTNNIKENTTSVQNLPRAPVIKKAPSSVIDLTNDP